MKNINIIFVLLAITLLLSGGCGYDHYLTTKSIQLSSGQSNMVKAMTFNIRTKTFIDGFNGWNNRKQIVLQVLANNAPDVIGLQEARYSQYRQIRESLPQYSAYSAGRNNGRESGEACPIYYRKDRFRLTDSGTFWFSDTPSVPGSKDWGNNRPRICSWIHLVETRSGAGFYVYNLHLDHRSQNSREKSVQLLAKQIKKRKIKDPFIVMGDFNMEIDNPAMRYLDRVGRENPLVKSSDTWQSIHPGRMIGTRHSFRGSLSGPHIDHIRISPKLQVLDARIDFRHGSNGRYPSDHFPLIAKILLAPSAKSRYISAATRETNTAIGDKNRPGV